MAVNGHSAIFARLVRDQLEAPDATPECLGCAANGQLASVCELR